MINNRVAEKGRNELNWIVNNTADLLSLKWWVPAKLLMRTKEGDQGVQWEQLGHNSLEQLHLCRAYSQAQVSTCLGVLKPKIRLNTIPGLLRTKIT